MNVPEIRFIIFKYENNDESKLTQVGYIYPICINRLKNTHNLDEDVTDYTSRLNNEHLEDIKNHPFGNVMMGANFEWYDTKW
jgi:hypothetical protein